VLTLSRIVDECTPLGGGVGGGRGRHAKHKREGLLLVVVVVSLLVRRCVIGVAGRVAGAYTR